MKLTPRQREFLKSALREGSAVAYDGFDMRTGRSLEAKGLVWLPGTFGFTTHSVSAARITDAGRRSLTKDNADTGGER